MPSAPAQASHHALKFYFQQISVATTLGSKFECWELSMDPKRNHVTPLRSESSWKGLSQGLERCKHYGTFYLHWQQAWWGGGADAHVLDMRGGQGHTITASTERESH